MASKRDDAPAGGEDGASVVGNAPFPRDGTWQGRGRDGVAASAIDGAGGGAGPDTRLRGGEDGEPWDHDLLGDANEQIQIHDGGAASGVTLIDPARLAREIGWDGFLGDPDERAEATSSEDEQRRAFLRRHARAPGGLFRRHLVADAGTAGRLDALEAEAPNATKVVDVVGRAASLSRHAGSPLRLPPLLLVGQPGTGKSRIARRIAEVLGAPLTTIDGGSVTDRGPIVGHDVGYRGAGPGQVAVALLDGRTTGPLVLLDEVDKVSAYSPTVRPLDALLPLLEPSTADRFLDTYVGLPLRAAGVSWILTANSVAGLPAPLLDRTLVIEMPPLGRAQAHDAIRRLFRELLAEHGLPACDLGVEAVKRLEGSGLRQARRALSLALGPALAAGRTAPSAADVAGAIALVGRPAPRPPRPPKASAPARAPVGFIRFPVAPSGSSRDVARPRGRG